MVDKLFSAESWNPGEIYSIFLLWKIENVKFWSFEVLVLLTFCTCGGSSHSGIVSFCKQELEIQAYLFESGLLTEEWRMQIRQHQEWSIKWKKGFSFPYSALGIKSKLWIWSKYLKTFFATHHFNSFAGNFDMSNLKIILHTFYLFLFILHFHFIVFEF